MQKRPSKDHYFLALAKAASARSEDPNHQVGAVAVTHDGWVIATAYNGLGPGQVASPEWWGDKECKKQFPVHAEENLCALFKRGEVETVALTLSPCPSCLRMLAAHGVERVIYEVMHKTHAQSKEIADFYDVALINIDDL